MARLLLFVLNAGTPVASDGLVCVQRPQVLPIPIRLAVYVEGDGKMDLGSRHEERIFVQGSMSLWHCRQGC